LDGQRCQLFAHFPFKQLHPFHEIRVGLAQPDVFLLQQPPRQSAHFPLGTHVWARPHDDIQPVSLRQPAKFGHIVVAREVEFSFLLFVDIPEHIEADGVHAQRLAHLDAMFPVGAGDARIVEFGSFHHKRFAVE
jgi:hypothetical protein